MHLIVVDAQRLVKMPLSSLAGISIVVVVVVILIYIYIFVVIVIHFLFSFRLVSIYVELYNLIYLINVYS